MENSFVNVGEVILTSLFIIHYSPSSTLLLVYIPGTTHLHILLHCTLYLIAHLTPYFISYLSLISFSPYLYIYIYSLVFCFIVFIAFMLLLCFIFILFFCTFHWADLSWLTFHYLLYPVWLCMWQIIKNLEPWTLTLLWQSGLLNQRLYVISLSICYWLFKCGVLRVVCVCVCVCERESQSCSVVCVCVCVCVCSCVWESKTRSHNHGLCANTYEFHYCVCHATLFPFRAWTDGKTKVIINYLYFSFKSWSSQLRKGELHFWRGLWCSANQKALGQLANQRSLCLSEGGTL